MVISKSCELCGCQLGDMSKKFYRYVRSQECDSLSKATGYPDIWSMDDKVCYLYHIISGKAPIERYIIKSKVNEDCEVKWPKHNNVIQQIRDLDSNNYFVETTDGWEHVCRYMPTGYDYLKLCRDSHKHFDDLPEYIKVPRLSLVASSVIYYLPKCP